MAESSACLMRSFSQPSSTSQDSQEGDPLRHALTTSVSFGRFMSESLAWEKWSSFTQNRYLEEVEKYAKPGSVAEKKAYFEAHYKRKASQRAAAAASLEQQNGAVNDVPASILENAVRAQGQENCCIAIEEGQDKENPTSDLSLSIDECSTSKCAQSPEGYNRESDQFEGLDQGTEPPTLVENLVELSTCPLEGFKAEKEHKNEQIDVINAGIEQQHAFVENRDELYFLPDDCKSPQRTCSVENEETEGTKQEKEHPTFVQKQVEASTIIKDAQCVIEQQEAKSPVLVVSSTQVSALSDKKKPASASAKLSGYKPGSRLRPPPKPTTQIQPKNGDLASSYHKRTGKESSEKRKSTLKSLHRSINFASHVGDTDKLSSPEIQKLANSGPSRNFYRTTRENTKQQTPIRASTSGVSKHLSATPRPVIGGTKKVMIHSISGSVIGDRKSESLYMRSSLSSTTCRPKAQHPIVSASFNLRTEERAAKRKEKLQQKLSMEAAEKEHLQARVKEKVRNDAKDMRNSVASQGKTNTSFHLGIEPLDVQMKKITRTQPFTPGIRRKLDSDVLHKPTWRHSVKADNFKDLLGKNHHLPPNHSTKLFPRKKCVNENTSPNIEV